MRVSRVATTIFAVAIVSGCGVTHHGAVAVTPSAAPAVASSTATSTPATSAPATSHPATSAPATSAPATHPVISAPVTSAPVTSAPATSAPVTSAPATAHPHTVRPTVRPTADPALVWLESAGGQTQVTFNDDVDALAAALEIESDSDTVANHLAFEADARIVRAQASKILATPALLPTVNQAAYKAMLNDFITVANLLQPGTGYGTAAQDETAWYAALAASNIIVS
jgi:hypothetical protein